jgi:Icc-related predicted phosphoesterase
MTVLCVSDIHDRFDDFKPDELPEADICLVAGDLTEFGHRGETHGTGEIRRAAIWLQKMGERYSGLFWIPGNHDIGVTARTFDDVPNGLCIMNQTVPVGGLTLHGISLTTCFAQPVLKEIWDYMTDAPEVDAAAFDFPPVDVVLSHGPPKGVLDGPGRWGSPGLLAYVKRHQPRLVVCGHIHEDGGRQERVGETLVINAARHAILFEFT